MHIYRKLTFSFYHQKAEWNGKTSYFNEITFHCMICIVFLFCSRTVLSNVATLGHVDFKSKIPTSYNNYSIVISIETGKWLSGKIF